MLLGFFGSTNNAEFIDIKIRNTTLTKEFGLARDLFGFTLHDFREVTIVAMKSAFLPHLERKEMIKDIANELETKFGILPEFVERKKLS